MPSSTWPLRSLLFLPAHKIEWVKKTALSEIDAVILDLEDSVPPARKHEARLLIAEEVAILKARDISVIVRTNSLDAGCEEDIAHVVCKGVTGIMLPKSNKAEDIHRLHALLDTAETAAAMHAGSVGILALPETAKGLWLAYEIAEASHRVTGLITAISGPVSGDVSRAAGFEPTYEGSEQLFLQSRIILASRAAGAMYPIGTIMGTRLDDLEMVEKLVRRGKQLGFTGAALLHPSHVTIANSVFRPSAEEVEYSNGLLQAMSEAKARGDWAVSYRGKMVDAAMLPKAQEVIESDGRYRARENKSQP